MSDNLERLVVFYESLSTKLIKSELHKLEVERYNIHDRSGERLGWRNERKLERIMPRIIAMREVLEGRNEKPLTLSEIWIGK